MAIQTKAHAYDLTATNAVWIALATMHERSPNIEGFTVREIEDEVASLNLFQKDPSTITQHIKQHLAAAKSSNAKPRRMVTELADGRRRLYIEGDEYHTSRTNSPTHPAVEDLPIEFRGLLHWYEGWSRLYQQQLNRIDSEDPLLALMGTWTFGDGDTYLRELREGWDDRP